MIKNPKMVYKLYEQRTYGDYLDRESTSLVLIAVADTAESLYTYLVLDKLLKITYTVDDGEKPK